jgi:uncharacterized protein (DUF2132 family)
MSEEQPNNPLHGLTLQAIVKDLVDRHGWEELGARIRIRCFTHDPSIKSSLKFLRKTEWARLQVEKLYLEDQRYIERRRQQNLRRASARARKLEYETTDEAAPDPDESSR